jgi:hypothetical protein
MNPGINQRFSTESKEMNRFVISKGPLLTSSIDVTNPIITARIHNDDVKVSILSASTPTASLSGILNTEQCLSTESKNEGPLSASSIGVTHSNSTSQLKNFDVTTLIVSAPPPTASSLEISDVGKLVLPPPPPAQLFSSHLDNKDLSSKSYGRSKRRIKQVVRYDTDDYSYKEMVKRRRMEGKCGSGFLCPRCSEHLSYHVKACVKCGLGCSYVPGSGVIISRDRDEVVKGERILQQRLVESQSSVSNEKIKLNTNHKLTPVKRKSKSKHKIKVRKNSDVKRHKLKRSMRPEPISERREEILTKQYMGEKLAEEEQPFCTENYEEKTECIQVPVPVTLDEIEWNPLSCTRLVRMPRYRHFLPRDCVTYDSLVNIVDEKLQRVQQQKGLHSRRNKNKLTKKDFDNNAAEEILYKRGLRARAGKVDSEKLEKISFKDKWEESQRKIQYENRGKKISAEEAETEKFLCRKLLFDDKAVGRNTRQNTCTFGQKCDLCNGWYASWVLTEKEVEKAGGILPAIPFDLKKRTEIPNLRFRRLELDEIPDDIHSPGKEINSNRVSTRSKGANDSRLNELRFNLQFIKRYNDGLLDERKGSNTSMKK